MKRKGMGLGTGKGYRNIIPFDKPVHQMSAKGIRQPQHLSYLGKCGGKSPFGKHKPKNLVDFGKQNQVSWAFSILSDAQELIDMGLYKEANEKINSSKRVLMGRYEVCDDGFSIRVFSRDEIRAMKEKSTKTHGGKATPSSETKPVLELTGQDGNAFAILGKARRVALANKMDWKQIEEEATSGDYDHLLQTMMKYFEVE